MRWRIGARWGPPPGAERAKWLMGTDQGNRYANTLPNGCVTDYDTFSAISAGDALGERLGRSVNASGRARGRDHSAAWASLRDCGARHWNWLLTGHHGSLLIAPTVVHRGCDTGGQSGQRERGKPRGLIDDRL